MNGNPINPPQGQGNGQPPVSDFNAPPSISGLNQEQQNIIREQGRGTPNYESATLANHVPQQPPQDGMGGTMDYGGSDYGSSQYGGGGGVPLPQVPDIQMNADGTPATPHDGEPQYFPAEENSQQYQQPTLRKKLGMFIKFIIILLAIAVGVAYYLLPKSAGKDGEQPNAEAGMAAGMVGASETAMMAASDALVGGGFDPTAVTLAASDNGLATALPADAAMGVLPASQAQDLTADTTPSLPPATASAVGLANDPTAQAADATGADQQPNPAAPAAAAQTTALPMKGKDGKPLWDNFFLENGMKDKDVQAEALKAKLEELTGKKYGLFPNEAETAATESVPTASEAAVPKDDATLYAEGLAAQRTNGPTEREAAQYRKQLAAERRAERKRQAAEKRAARKPRAEVPPPKAGRAKKTIDVDTEPKVSRLLPYDVRGIVFGQMWLHTKSGERSYINGDTLPNGAVITDINPNSRIVKTSKGAYKIP